ncbi:MAG: helix-turn-helix domain-containing protein [Pseudomonadota bacterium]
MNRKFASKIGTEGANAPSCPIPALLLTDHECIAALGCARSTFWKWVQEGKFPRPAKLGGMSRWPATDIEAFIAQATAARDAA